jgi:hypothetical protein
LALARLALGLLAAWVGLSVHHLVDKLYVNNIYIHLGLMLALLHLLRLDNRIGFIFCVGNLIWKFMKGYSFMRAMVADMQSALG